MAYEPLPHLAGQLRQRFPSIAVRQKALSNSPGESDFVFVPEMPGYSGLRERHYPGVVTKQRIRVLTERLDDAWPRRRRLAVMIVDVEGAERLVFEGAIGTLRRSRPTIVFEHGIGGADRYDTKPRDIHDLLVRNVGLRIFDLDGGGPFSVQAFEDEYASGRHWNFVAHE